MLTSSDDDYGDMPMTFADLVLCWVVSAVCPAVFADGSDVAICTSMQFVQV